MFFNNILYIIVLKIDIFFNDFKLYICNVIRFEYLSIVGLIEIYL